MNIIFPLSSGSYDLYLAVSIWLVCCRIGKLIQPTKEKPPDIDLEDKSKTNIVFCATLYPSTTKEGKYTQIYADSSPPIKVGETNIFTSCMCMVVTPS